jgi:dienelactone hydrolase
LVVVPPDKDAPCPVVLWMHGRTVTKELDPGRYLRWMRAGIGVCAVDLPGHGERHDDELQRPERAYDVAERMLEEIDGVLGALWSLDLFDADRVGIGGVSGGGLAALARLCEPHRFACAAVEATCGSWASLRGQPIFAAPETWARARALDPIGRLGQWREIPLQVIHARHDEWMPASAQREFTGALRERYRDPALVELIEYERTGAPYEHVGFGSMAADAKSRQLAFFRRWLIG